MPIYIYTGFDRSGKEVKSSLTAENPAIAKQRIKSSGVMILDMTEQKSNTREQKTQHVISFGTGVGVSDLAMMTRQLATLVKANIQLVEAISTLIDQVSNQKLRIILSEVKKKVNEGSSLAQSLADYPKIFNNVYINMIEAGETSGTLHIVLIRLAEFTEAQMKLKNKIQTAMIYPTIMGIFGFLMMNVIFLFAIPKITKIFETRKIEIPLQTKICIWISSSIQNYWWLFLILVIAGQYIFRKWKASPGGRSTWDHLILKVPLIGDLVTMINVGRFCSTLATLLDSSVPILASMNIVKNIVANVHMSKAINEAKDAVSEGASMVGPLIKSNLFPPMVTHMIRLGEKSGELGPMLQIAAENYEDQVESRLTGLTSVLEPIMIIALGLVVGFIVFSVIVPMMKLNTLR